jgi:carboxymethylenebutenolidase
LNRRDFLLTKLSTGFALATLPISAATITTDTEGLDAGEISISVGDGKIPGYRAAPNGRPSPWSWWFRRFSACTKHPDLCRRFAKLGYLAIAPELYARQAMSRA